MNFHDFPAQHPNIKSKRRHRSKRVKGCLSRDGMLKMMFKLGQCAEKCWRKLRGFAHLANVKEASIL